jgi:lysophospholipase L1-like esterase
MQTLNRTRMPDETRRHGVDVLERDPERPGEAREPRKTSPLRVFVTIVVCLLLWTLLAAPILERDAEAGPFGARRTAAITLLRPLVAISDALFLSRATGTMERALGRDPNEQPGGELELPAFALPDESDVAPAGTSPAGDGEGRSGGHEGEGQGANAGSQAQVEAIRTPSPTNELRVAVIGDSLSQGLGPAIARWMNPSVVRVLSLGRQSTGLSREDYFNWQAGMREIVERFRPDLVFVMLGSNDAQAQISPDGSAIPVGTWEWVQGYRERAEQLVREATRAGTRVAWVGIPIVRERKRWGFYRNVNEIYRETASSDPNSTFVDTWNAFRGRDGGYSAFVRSDHGQLVEVRAGDGIHFTPAGYGMLGKLALRSADQAFGMPQRAVTFRV